MKVYIDGAITSPARARVSVLDHGLLYGDGVFEGIRIRSRRIFRLDAHLGRLAASADAIGLAIPGGLTEAKNAALQAARALDQDEAYLRLVVTRGVGPLGIDPTECTPKLFCVAGEIALFKDVPPGGISMVTSWLRRPDADMLDPRIKSLNYLNNVLAKREAKLRGAHDALLLNRAGRVAEASGANVFVYRQGRLLTPPPYEGALEGLTRRAVLDIARDLGMDADEEPLTRADLLSADEVFLTGSGAGIVPVASLDGVDLRGRERTRVSDGLLEALIPFTVKNGTGF